MAARGPRSWWMMATAAVVLVAGILVVALELSGGGRRWTDDRRIDVPVRGTSPRDVLWEPPEMVSLPTLDAVTDAYAPFRSPNGLELFLVRGRARGIAGRGPGDEAGAEILLSRRGPGGWSAPEPIAAISSPADELHPALSPDGRWLYFSSDRPGGAGGFDLWRIPRDGDGDGGWGAAEPLGQRVNTAHDELSPAWSPDGRRLWFASDRPREIADAAADRGGWGGTMRAPRGGRRDFDLHFAVAGDAGLSAAARVAELSGAADEGTPAVSPAGDFLYFASDREGGAGGFDLYRVRLNDGVPAGDPIRPLDGVNSPADELDPALDLEGFGLVFASNRASTDAGGDAAGERLWRSISREVRAREDELVARFDWGAILPAIPWLLALLLLALLAWLLRALHVSGRLATIGLLTRCLLASALVHMILALLLGAWTVSGALADGFSDRGGGTARLSSAAIGGGLERQLFGAAGEPLAAPETDESWTEVPNDLRVAAPTIDALPARAAPPPVPATPGDIAMAMRPIAGVPARAGALPMGAAAASPPAAEPLAVPRAPDVPMPAMAPSVSTRRRAVETPLDLTTTSAAAGTQAARPSSVATAVAAAEVPASPHAARSAPTPPAAGARVVPRPASPTGRAAAALVEPSGAITGAGARTAPRATDSPLMPDAVAVAAPAEMPGPEAPAPRAAPAETSHIATLDAMAAAVAAPSPAPSPAPTSPADAALAPLAGAAPLAVMAASAPVRPSARPTPDGATPEPAAAGRAVIAPPEPSSLAELVPAASSTVSSAPVPVPTIAIARDGGSAEERPSAWDDAAARVRAPVAAAAIAPTPSATATAAAAAAPGPGPGPPPLDIAVAALAPAPSSRVPEPSARVVATDLAFAAAGSNPPSAGDPMPLPPAVVIPGPALPIPAVVAASVAATDDPEDEATRVEAAVAAAAKEAGLTRVIIGRVLDDETGRPLPGAEVRLDVRDADALVAAVDEAGWYLLLAPDGPASVAITATRPGHLPASANVTADERRGAVVRRDLRLAADAGRRIALEAEPRVRHVGDDAFSGVVNSRFQRASDGPEVTIVFTLDQAWVAAARIRGTVVLSTLVRGAQRDNPVSLNGRRLPRGLDESPRDGRFGEVRRRFPADLLREGENVLRIRSAASGIGGDIDDFEFVNVQLEATDDGVPPDRRRGRRRVDL